MNFTEYPSVEQGDNRGLEFPHITWLTNDQFKKEMIKGTESSTRGSNEFQPFVESETNQRSYIGKTIPRTPRPFILNGVVSHSINHFGACPYEYLELIGNVHRTSERSIWKLRVTHGGQTFEVEDNFLVLRIENPDSYFWSSNRKPTSRQTSGYHSFVFNGADVPRYALRASVDVLECKYNYIGRTLAEEHHGVRGNSVNNRESDLEGYQDSQLLQRPKFYANSWLQFNEHIPQTLGKVSQTYRLLWAPVNNLEVGFDECKFIFTIFFVFKQRLFI